MRKILCVIWILAITISITGCAKKELDNFVFTEFIQDSHFTIYYGNGEAEEKAANDIMCKIKDEKEYIWEKLNIVEPVHMIIFMFDKIDSFKEAFLKYSGASKMENYAVGTCFAGGVILASPNLNLGNHSYYSMISTVPVHEMVHFYCQQYGGGIYSAVLSEGVAYYLAAGEKGAGKPNSAIPTFEQVYFNSINPAAYCYSYVNFLDKTYGWDKTLELIKTENYEKTLGKSEKQIYNEWVEFLK